MINRPVPIACPRTGHHFIRTYENAFPADFCQALIDRYDSDVRFRRQGEIGNHLVRPSFKRCLETPITGVWKDLDDKVLELTRGAVNLYAKDVPLFGLIQSGCSLTDTGYLLQVYQPSSTDLDAGGDGFDWHCDSATASSRGRLLAIIIYLNDVAEGGQTEFRAQQISVRPTTGSVLLFPPTFEYEHRGVTPISNRKAIVTSFISFKDLPHAYDAADR
jgi:hypothetical protein